MALVPVGISDFKELREDGYLTVDKTMLVAEILRSGAKVTLLPRPRRFGKTLNLSMLHRFLDIREDNRGLFEDLALSKHPDVMALCGSFPTVFLTLEDVKYDDFESCTKALSLLLADLYKEHRELIERASPEDVDAQMVYALRNATADPSKAAYAFEFKAAGERDGENQAGVALQQIIDRDYAAQAREVGVNRVYAVGIAVCGTRTSLRP